MDLTSSLGAVSWLACIAAAVSSFFVGGLWYGPLFGTAWMKEFNFTEEDLKKRNLPKTFGLSLLLSLIAAITLEMFIGPEANTMFGSIAGFLAGFGWVSTMLGILYLFEMQSLKAYLINAGYCVVALTLMGAILGTW
ncbi:MAG: DUF1761 domain-containing protein [Reichenbachiella sp.]|uniref:DUF1761 domain-containing protein n=1 Tax=Reichenbachiella sp. TaxID=2184521 RepID=UPI0032649304